VRCRSLRRDWVARQSHRLLSEEARSCRPGLFFSTYARFVGTLLGNSGATVLNLIILASAVVPLTIVGILCWIFWRAAHRKDDA
jgi:hypothetical protein